MNLNLKKLLPFFVIAFLIVISDVLLIFFLHKNNIVAQNKNITSKIKNDANNLLPFLYHSGNSKHFYNALNGYEHLTCISVKDSFNNILFNAGDPIKCTNDVSGFNYIGQKTLSISYGLPEYGIGITFAKYKSIGIISFLIKSIFLFIIFTFYLKYQKSRKDTDLALQARYVKHNVLSPLSTLKGVIETADISGETRSTLLSVSNTIEDLINELRDKSNINQEQYILKENHLLLMLESLISDKRVEINNKNVPGEIIKKFEYIELRDIFIGCSEVDFKTCLSNIINNAFEACPHKAIIEIEVTKNNYEVIISIKDNGIGIPKAIQDKIFNDGFTYNKKSGSGHGLFQAKQTTTKYNGILQFQSTINVGSIFTIKFPIIDPPRWFCSNIPLMDTQTVVVLDDDSSIHQIIANKISQSFPKLQILHFERVNDFENWFLENGNQKTFYYIDYYYKNEKLTGIDIIKMYNLTNAVLISGYFEKNVILENVIKNNIMILPKLLIPFTPLHKMDLKRRIILIDDSAHILNSYKHFLERRNVQIKTFQPQKDLLIHLKNLDKNDLIFIDAHFDESSNLTGLDVYRHLHENGFKNIHIHTAEPHLIKERNISLITKNNPLKFFNYLSESYKEESDDPNTYQSFTD